MRARCQMWEFAAVRFYRSLAESLQGMKPPRHGQRPSWARIALPPALANRLPRQGRCITFGAFGLASCRLGKGPPVPAPGEPTLWVELLLCGAGSLLCGAASFPRFTPLRASCTALLTSLRASCTPLLTPLCTSFAPFLTPLRPCLAWLACLACLARLARLALRCPLRLSLGV